MVSIYFGVPGCGKTTTAVMLMREEAIKMFYGKSKYKHIYCNFPQCIPLVQTIPFDYLGKYDLSDSLIIIDEASIFVDSRDYKMFSNQLRDFILLHRHYNCSIYLFSQGWDRIDKTFRVITEKVYYLKKGFLPHTTIIYPLMYGVYIPSSSADKDGEYGEISQGYKLPPLLNRIFATRFNRKPYYKYFDSYSVKELPPIPSSDPTDFKEYVK